MRVLSGPDRHSADITAAQEGPKLVVMPSAGLFFTVATSGFFQHLQES